MNPAFFDPFFFTTLIPPKRRDEVLGEEQAEALNYFLDRLQFTSEEAGIQQLMRVWGLPREEAMRRFRLWRRRRTIKVPIRQDPVLIDPFDPLTTFENL